MATYVPRRQLRTRGGQFAQGRHGVLWSGIEATANNINKRGKTLNDSRKKAMERLGAEMEAYAKANRPWKDRTTDARVGLQAVVLHDDQQQTSTVYMSHTVGYGLWLELGNYPILLPTLMHFAPRVGAKFREVDSVDSILDRVFNGEGEGED